MKEPEKINIIYNGRSIAKNTIYNLLGYGIPLVFAFFFIPPLIKGLGVERFGILNLVWTVIGYFSFFDFGIGRVLTKIIAEKIGLHQTDEIPSLFWTSFILMVIISLILSILLIFLTPTLVHNFFNISKNLKNEALNTFYVLAISLPIIITTAGLRGFLEAYQKFGVINIIRIILGIFTFLGPLLCLIFSPSLFWIVIFLTFIRIIIWNLYFIQCFRINVDLKRKLNFEIKQIKSIFKLGSWMTISNILGPLITYLDRFLIGALISAVAITFYVTPFEIVTKLLIVPGALVGVLFPAFSASYFKNREDSKKLLDSALKFVFLILFPIVLLIVTFSYEILNLWLGEKFADNSYLILKLLAIGILFNSIAHIPFTFLQGIGRPDIPSKINLLEVPIYLLILWVVVKQWDINGVALIFTVRTAIEAAIFIIITNKTFGSNFGSKSRIYSFLVMIFTLFVPFILNILFYKIIFSVAVLIIFGIVTWKHFLQTEEKIFLSSKLKMIRF